MTEEKPDMTYTNLHLVHILLANGFNLGGSRRMAQKYPDHISISSGTDWDIYGSDTIKNRQMLDDMGFKKIEYSNKEYWDGLLVDVYKNSDGTIEVLLRSDPDLYRNVFESIDPITYMHFLWKSSPYLKNLKSEEKAVLREKIRKYFDHCFDYQRSKND